MDQLQSYFLNNRKTLLGFIKKKVHDADLAEDILQDSLLKALRSGDELRDGEKLLPWFYRVMQNAIIDHYRKEQREIKRLEEFTELETARLKPEDEAALCECFKELIPGLKPEYAEVLEEVELKDQSPEMAADKLGITRNNLKVRLHRARLQLRERLEDTCQACAKHGCLNCSCAK